MRHDLLTPHTRGLIVRQLNADPSHTWTGRRGSIRMSFSISGQPTLEGDRIEWRARVRGRWYQGKSGTVSDAAAAISQLDHATAEQEARRTH